MKLNKHALHSKKGVLLKNTIMLYIMQFSTYFLSFIVVPYETRVLGATVYGKVGVATAIMVYFQLVIDFGFILSATEEVSLHRDDKQRVSRIFTSVTINKILLTIGSIVVLAVLCQAMPSWREDRTFYMLFLVATAVNSMMPDYLYRGLEQMETITIRAVVIKAFFTVMIVLLLKKPEQYCLIPILNIIGYAATLLFVYAHLSRKLDIHFTRVHAKDVWNNFRRSSTFFYSRIATSIYTASNTVILSIIAAGTSTVGYYSLSDKLVTTAKSGLSPISDSMYPYMTKNKDFKLVWENSQNFHANHCHWLCGRRCFRPPAADHCIRRRLWRCRTGSARHAAGCHRDSAELYFGFPNAQCHGTVQIRKLFRRFRLCPARV